MPVAVHRAVVGERVEVVRLVEPAQRGEIEGRHAETEARRTARPPRGGSAPVTTVATRRVDPALLPDDLAPGDRAARGARLVATSRVRRVRDAERSRLRAGLRAALERVRRARRDGDARA